MRKARIKRAARVLAGILLTGLLGGCWDYRGLNELTLVAGMSIDIDEDTGLLQLNFEVIDLTIPIEQEAMKTFLLQSEGENIFDAIRDAKRKISNKLYFGETNLVIISKEVVETHGVFSVVEWFLRDNETRENMYIAMAQTEKAKDILNLKLRENSIVSYDLSEIIKEDSKDTASTMKSEIYEVYNTLKQEGISLVLPALAGQKKNDDRIVPAVNGVIVFRDGKIVGELTPEETKFFLYATNHVEGGLLSFSSSGSGKKDVVLEIEKNKTKRSFECNDGAITVRIETETEAYVGEVMREADLLEQETYKAFKAAAEEELKTEIEKVVKKVQKEYKTDIFGFGRMIRKKDLGLWKEIGKDWDEIFPEAEIEVSCKISLLNTAHIKNTKKE